MTIRTLRRGSCPGLRGLPLLALALLLPGACSLADGTDDAPTATTRPPTTTAEAAHVTASPGGIAAYPPPKMTTRRSQPTRTATVAPGPTPSTSPAASATSASTRTPTPSTQASELFVDGPGGRIFTSQDVDGEPRLLTYRTVDGKLVDSHLLREGEQLLGIDEAGRLHLRQPEIGLRVLDAEGYGTIAEMLFPTLAVSNVIESGEFRRGPPSPLLHRSTGRVFTFERATVQVLDPIAGSVVQNVELPPHDGPIVAAVLSADDRHLYVLLTVPHDSFPHGSTVFSLDTENGSLVDRRDYGPAVRDLRGLGNHLVASGSWPGYGGIGHFIDHWSDGRPVQLLTQAPRFQYGIFDGQRDRILVRADISVPGEPLGIFDGSTLGPLFVASVADFGRPEVYDEATDRFFGRGRIERLQIFDPGTLAPDPVPALSAASLVPAEEVRALQSWLPWDRASHEPLLMTGLIEVRPASGDGGTDWQEVISRDGGETWERDERVGIPSGWGCTSPSPDYEQDRQLFACATGGVYRSEDAGRSWSPLGPGIRTLEMQQIVISPSFAKDRTLFVSSFERNGDPLAPGLSTGSDAEGAAPRPRRDTAWRSEDEGATWEPIGHVATLALDPGFGDNARTFAFEHRGVRFLASEDAGRSWEPRGRLPVIGDPYVANRLWIVPATESTPRVLLALASNVEPPINGMIPKWPSMDSRLFRSIDEGWSWELVWPPVDESDADRLFSDLQSLDPHSMDGRLMGPLDGGVEGPTWLLEPGLENSTVLLSEDGLDWAPYHLPDKPGARFLGLREDGRLLFSASYSGVEETSIDALRPGVGPRW